MSNIAHRQALRVRQICSNAEAYLRTAEELKEYLVHRGYKRAEVQQQIDRATNGARTEALTMSETNKNTERVPLVVTFHPELPSLGEIICDHLPTLYISEKMKNAVANPPLVAKDGPKIKKNF